ncbi:MAG: nucleoside triphosphate pyrophosphohydrolase [Oligoflexia bacterium]|nr:nucleoside triphosphate pyrophosphohydrolase [Oligoflexia bacterium]
MTNIDKLMEIMARLRQPDGCPWDREQSHQSLKRFLIEETYEVVEAIETGSLTALREELGDLLLQVVFHAQVADENGNFGMQDVIDGICDKLLRRHPHVFDKANADTAKDVEIQWERIKDGEIKRSGTGKSVIDGVPKAMPSLLQALRITEKAARVGFDWKTPEQVIDKIKEELGELEEAMRSGGKMELEHELGDLLFAACNLARHCEIDPETSHQGCIERFKSRFREMEKTAKTENKKLSEYNLEELETLWQKAKKTVS